MWAILSVGCAGFTGINSLCISVLTGAVGTRNVGFSDPAPLRTPFQDASRELRRHRSVPSNPEIQRSLQRRLLLRRDQIAVASSESLSVREAKDRLQRLGGIIGSGRLLEVGCGEGAFLQEARDAGWEVVGIEPSEPSV